MTDRSGDLNEVLKSHDARPIKDAPLSLDNINGFIKEAYRINLHIASLNSYLRSVRESYLSTAIRPSGTSKAAKSKFLSDRQKDEIDAAAKQTLREINNAVRGFEEAEQLRKETESLITKKKYKKLAGALVSWAAGGAGNTKSLDQELDEARSQAVTTYHEGVILYLRQKLKECVELQSSMMEIRINRELEKRRGDLKAAKPRAAGLSTFGSPTNTYAPDSPTYAEKSQFQPEDLDEEQLQMFEENNQDLVKHYETTLNQVVTAEKSLREISELQTQIMENLNMQSENIGQVVEDSFSMTEDVGMGNKELKKASQRGSTAKYVFYASCGLSLFLVTWDLLI